MPKKIKKYKNYIAPVEVTVQRKIQLQRDHVLALSLGRGAYPAIDIHLTKHFMQGVKYQSDEIVDVNRDVYVTTDVAKGEVRDLRDAWGFVDFLRAVVFNDTRRKAIQDGDVHFNFCEGRNMAVNPDYVDYVAEVWNKSGRNYLGVALFFNAFAQQAERVQKGLIAMRVDYFKAPVHYHGELACLVDTNEPVARIADRLNAEVLDTTPIGAGLRRYQL